MKKRIIILGSTGSIGKSTLEAIENQPDEFEVIGLACRENVRLFNEQIRKFKPRFACLYENGLQSRVDFGTTRRLIGPDGIKELVRSDADMIVNALPGSIGLEPTIEVLKQNRTLALANKESLVMAGRLILKMTKENRGRLIPIDSEHSALYQLMEGMEKSEIDSLVITASGGPFKNHSKADLENVTSQEALCHPTWQMGRKVTIDSATLMNKGLEVIEARWLFDILPERINVLVHHESILHGMVQLTDGSLFAYLALPDMKIPIAFALNGARRKTLPFGKVNLADLGKLTFYAPDLERFPALRLAYDALRAGDSAVITLNAANEIASSAFLEGRIGFTEIPRLVEQALSCQSFVKEIDDLDTVWEIHGLAKAYLEDHLRRINA
ncbi:MAG: 1-deoxy-D-xylulose 5-phosphate reductoisomerase [Syntrophorhabdaceae bacterium PtaU1.Bin034]|jgi:1-deoxy-D-xylulose-5-phosphate reductoisomerase|nr:MAG: 1-deoxy-D-xylulose 5-phosphate reductoisomerase [Syntrophorhabdaceae bacterium PtaU1.Bin034]